jgi:hypothetical protein
MAGEHQDAGALAKAIVGKKLEGQKMASEKCADEAEDVGLETAAEELLGAIKDGDKKALLAAFRAVSKLMK